MAMDEIEPVACYWCGKPILPRKSRQWYEISCPCGYRIRADWDGMEVYKAQNTLDGS